MGKCYSCFRAKFTPSSQDGKTGGLPLVPTRKPSKPDVPGDLPRPPSVDSNISPDKQNDDDVLVVQGIDLHLDENVAAHYTGDYDIVQAEKPCLVLRRGFPFKLGINFNRSYDKEKDVVCLVFTAKDAANPSYSQGSMIFCPVMPSDNAVLPSDAWQAKLLSGTEENTILVEVTTTPNCIVGDWILEVDTKLKEEKEGQSKSLRYTAKQPVYILFNPWCKQDTVYMSEYEHRKEYVLNEGGLIWRGTNNRLRPCVWNYGQFEEDVMQCAVYLLGHIAKLSIVARADPVKVVRHISAVVNSPDDNGVLVGNWSADYGGGQPPTHWTGSVAILQQYYKTKKPVKFGQCWVFSGVVTTVCRALGIPCRSVTNFASAHDTHNSLTIDYFYDEEGEPLDKLNIDSVWNFHVWNEVWMERPDLEPGGYSGWQAIDATPQEESDGLYRCGPCSVAAIKRGEIQKNYDGPFVFAEVNADKVYWRFRGKNQPLKLINRKTEAIGQFISTKAIGAYEREDITTEYKYSENSKEEREVMLRALRQCGNVFSRYYLNDEFEDVSFDFQLLDDIVIGQPFNVKLTMKNKGLEKKTYTVKGVLAVHTVLYTGQLKNAVKKERFEVNIGEGAEKEVIMNVSYDEYEKLLVDQAAFNMIAMANVEETGFDYFAQDDFRVRKPDIKFEIEGDLVQGEEFKVTAQFKNPLPRPLRKGYFVIEGPGLGQPLKLRLKEDVAPDAMAKVSCSIRPKTSGEKNIAAKFASRELDDVDGYIVIDVKPKIVVTEPENNKPSDNEIPLYPTVDGN
ncbi:Annulin like protein [Argiope bruennichi]|uniref:protein-glutamine gamma-glutamyltransferase n=1 Tax=Argiope bruennichi TaxID=94029 RepID=A0A8T0FB20_ARGBR|nr:Annulin like protein [Argiope bruennichi]